MAERSPEDESYTVGNPSVFLAGLAEDGYSGRAALAAFREAGGHMGNERFRDLYGEVQAAVTQRSEAAGLPLDQLPDASSYRPWTMGRSEGYATNVDVQFVDRETGIVGTTTMTYWTSDPHTPGEAHANIQADWEDADTVDTLQRTWLGSTTRGVYKTSPAK